MTIKINRIMKFLMPGSFVFMLLFAESVWSQDINSNLLWESNHLTDTKSGEEVAYAGKLVTGGNKVLWKQGSPEFSTEFVVIKAMGSWTNVQEDGSIIYEVKSMNRVGTLEFRRTGSDVRVTFNFPEAGINTMPIVLQISKVSPQ